MRVTQEIFVKARAAAERRLAQYLVEGRVEDGAQLLDLLVGFAVRAALADLPEPKETP